MTVTPLTFVPVFIGLALHIAGFVAPLPPQPQCFADATLDDRAAWPAVQMVQVDLHRSEARRRINAPRAAAVPCPTESRPTSCLRQAQDTLALPAVIDRPAPETRLAAVEARRDTRMPAAMVHAAPRESGARLTKDAGAPVLP